MSSIYYSPFGETLEYYGYDAQNRRTWSWAGAMDTYGNTTSYTLNMYTPGGQKLAAYQIATVFVDNAQTGYQVKPGLNVTLSTSDTYFGARRLATIDQLGSSVYNSGSSGSFFPWGEAKGGYNPQDTWNFATYWQDSTTALDYANNRYYTNAYGRFMTPDPFSNSGRLNEPQSWNRYAYALGDPANLHDPTGLLPTLTCPEGNEDDDFGENCDFWAPDSCPMLNGGISPFCGNMQAGEFLNVQGSSGAKTINVKHFSTTSNQAQQVQNDLRWLEQAIAGDTDCSKWLTTSVGNYATAIDFDLGDTSYSTTMRVGVGSFSTTDNAVAGTAGTNLPSGTMITINTNGAFFNAGPSTFVGYGIPSWITGGSFAAQAEILLHELAHNVGAAGFQDDGGPNNSGPQTSNNQLVLQNCGNVIKQAAGN